MVKYVAQAKKVGGSLMVRIPADIAAQEGIEEGDEVDLSVRKVRKSWFGAFPELKEWTKKDRTRLRYG